MQILALKPTEQDAVRGETTTQQGQSKCQKELLDNNYLTGLQDWSLDDQKEARDLIVEYTSIFIMLDMDLDKISLVKHSIRLTDKTPFLECYWHILLSMYE